MRIRNRSALVAAPRRLCPISRGATGVLGARSNRRGCDREARPRQQASASTVLHPLPRRRVGVRMADDSPPLSADVAHAGTMHVGEFEHEGRCGISIKSAFRGGTETSIWHLGPKLILLILFRTCSPGTLERRGAWNSMAATKGNKKTKKKSQLPGTQTRLDLPDRVLIPSIIYQGSGSGNPCPDIGVGRESRNLELNNRDLKRCGVNLRIFEFNNIALGGRKPWCRLVVLPVVMSRGSAKVRKHDLPMLERWQCNISEPFRAAIASVAGLEGTMRSGRDSW